jgi:HK97 family phage major capsid protein
MNSLQIKDKKAELKKKALELIETCKTEIRDFTSAEADEYNSIKVQIEELNDELRKIDAELNKEDNNKTNLINTKKNMEFRLIKAINDIANNRNLDETASAVIEKGAEEMRKAGLSSEGQILLPTEQRAAITVASEGEDVVETDFTSILEPLRAKNVLVNAGATFLTGLVGDVQVPVMAGSNVTWEGETAAASDGAGSFSNVKLTPKRLTCYVDVSKQFLVQDSLDAENLIKRDIINAINSKLESTILGSAAGSATQPAGLFYVAAGDSLTSIADYGDICDLEADVEDANVNGECKYVMSNKAKAALRGMIKGTNNTGMVFEHGQVDGTEAYNTSNVEGKNIAFGDFSNLAIGQWGAIDLTVDPFTQATNGKVRLVVNAYFDAKVLREGAIAVGTIA